MNNPFTAVMISCLERRNYRARTLINISKTDWPDAVAVCMDDGKLETPQERQTANALKALNLGIEKGTPYILFLEDDLDFNEFIYHNLIHWPVLKSVTFASLYNCNIREVRKRPKEFCFEAVPDAVYGSQAYVLSRSCAQFIVRDWESVVGMQDIRMSRIAAKLGNPLFYYTPSLVQHLGKESTFGGTFHQCVDFNPTFMIKT